MFFGFCLWKNENPGGDGGVFDFLIVVEKLNRQKNDKERVQIAGAVLLL